MRSELLIENFRNSTISTLVGFNSSGSPINIALGSNLNLTGSTLNALGGVTPVSGSGLTWDTDRYNLGGDLTQTVSFNGAVDFYLGDSTRLSSIQLSTGVSARFSEYYSDESSMILAHRNTTLDTRGRIQMTDTTTTISRTPANNVTPIVGIQLNTAANQFLIIDNRGSDASGLEYEADYSANYTNRSIPDVEWVLSQVGGGGGITNTAINNELMKSDGTNAVPSGLFSTGLGSINLGSSSIAAGRAITVVSSSANASLDISAKGNTVINIGSTGTTSSTVNIANAGGVFDSFNFTTTSASNTLTGGLSSTGNPFIITGRQSTIENIKGSDLQILAGAAYSISGNANGGNVFINTGEKTGTGLRGNIGLFTTSVANWQGMQRGQFIADVTSPATAAISGGVTLYSEASILKTWNDVEIVDDTKGIIMRGTGTTDRYRITINGSGEIVVVGPI